MKGFRSQKLGVRSQNSEDRRGFLLYVFFLLYSFFCILSPSFSYAARTGHANTTSKNGSVKVTEIRYWSNPSYTRAVIDLSGDAKIIHRLLKEDRNLQKPRRLVIDIRNASLGPSLKEPIPINDGFLKMARAGQYDKDTVRVVLDLESIEDYKVFPLSEPSRIVVDVMGQKSSNTAVSQSGAEWGISAVVSPQKPSLPQQLGLKIRRIVIDAGHGGKDPGAIGKNGLREKDVALKVANGLKESLQRETGAEIIMTRDDDTFIPLEERTAIANATEADIFISVHANASFNRRASGVETYFLNLTSDEMAIRVAARENAVSTKKMSDLQYILNDLMKTAKTNESSRLAAAVQGSLVSALRARFSDVNGNGIKGAPFYVLVGTHMPSILVEVSFISNPKEEARLADSSYLQDIVNGITEGVNRYVKEMEVAVE